MTDLLDAVADLLRTVARAELIPRFGRLAATDIASKPSELDPTDIVTAADLAVEAWLGPRLKSLIAGSLVVGEEQASKHPAALDVLHGDAPVWLCDPLDGTRNFALGSGPFGIMVALVERGEIVLGSIHLPQTDCLYQALRGEGVTLNGAPMERAAPAERAPRGTVYTKFMHPDVASKLDARANSAARLGRLTRVDPVLCAAHQYTELASGREDFALYERLLPWDHAPGVLLLREAGGVCRHVDGREYRASDRSGPALMATNSTRWDEAHALLLG